MNVHLIIGGLVMVLVTILGLSKTADAAHASDSKTIIVFCIGVVLIVWGLKDAACPTNASEIPKMYSAYPYY